MCSSDFYSKYIINGKIGEGTFSEVLKSQKYSTGQYFAVKKLKKQYTSLNEVQNLPELLVLEKLPSHPNVLSLLESIFDVNEGKLFMIFELMEMSLYDLIQSRKRCLPENKVKHIFYQLLKGVEHLHSHGIFHRDIKPENILIKKTLVKLADLGSIRGTYSQQPYTEYISTRWYRAPECILTSGVYGPKMDVWACGCVFYELLTSKPIYPGANEIDQLTKIHQIVGTPNIRILTKLRKNKSRIGDVKFASFPSVNLAVLLPFTSEGGRELLKRMMAYDPDSRASVRKLLEHRYFNDLRDAELLLTSPAKLWNSSATSSRSKPTVPSSTGTTKSAVSTSSKKTTKLTTNTWAPSTNTAKVIKDTKNKLPSANVKKKSQLPISTKNIGKPEVKPVLTTLSNKKQRMKAMTLGNLPTFEVNPSTESLTTLRKGQISGYGYRKTSKNFLPPIPEQQILSTDRF